MKAKKDYNKYQIDQFSINFSNGELRNLSLITGLSFNEVREKVSYLVAALLNILIIENRDLRSELDRIIQVRSQFVIPDKLFSKIDTEGSNEIFFDDSNFVLSQLLNKDQEEVISEISRFVQIEKATVTEIFTYITPIFLNKLTQFFEISGVDFSVENSFVPSLHIVEGDVHRGNLDFETEQLKKLVDVFKNAFVNFRSILKKTDKTTFALFVALFVTGVILFFVVKQFVDKDVLKHYEWGKKRHLTEISKTEIRKNKKVEDKLILESEKSEKQEDVPFLDPDFPEDSIEHQLIPYLSESNKTLPSSIFKINGFKYSNGEVLISEYLIEDIFYLSRLLKMFPNVEIALQADDNKFLSSNSTLQDVYMKNFKDLLVESGVFEKQVKVEYIVGIEEVERFKMLGEFSNGLVYFRVIKN